MLEGMTVRQSRPGLLTLAAPPARAVMARDHLEEIVQLVQQTGARSVSISIVEFQQGAGTQQGAGSAGAEQTGKTPEQAPQIDTTHAADHPLVKQAEQVFGAKVVRIQPKR